MKIFTRVFLSLSLTITLLMFSFPPGSAADEIEEAPLDSTVSDICEPSDCNPARPCEEEGESCYTINGAFYCCVEPPSGGAEAVGE